MDHTVGIGGYAISNNQNDVIKTFALSTCVGIVFYSVRKRAMGMAHIQLPNSRSMHSGDKLSRFADTTPKFMFEELHKNYGITKGELLISLYGGIDRRGDNDCFCIGEKNLATVKSSLKALGMVYNEVDTGGFDSRTLIAYVNSGVVEVLKRPMALGGGIGTRPATPNKPAPGQAFGKSPFSSGRFPR